MSYIVLARKWRPNNFKDITGQEFITTTLINSISMGKLAHAILFSGPRGVGKTSTARIVAMSLNCVNGPTDKPCQTCNHCIEIKAGKSLDVIEIDAASHTGVNDVREIIDNIKYLPVSSRNKIYIIDEIHMLSNSAFNALLKTLEEPPVHVVFLMATTEVNKIPLTILSRCQRFDFRKISSADIKNTLVKICSTENIKIDDDTLHLIATEADGSLRDALSLLDQLNTTFDGNISYQNAISLFGFIDKSSTLSLFENVIKQDAKQSLMIVNKLNSMGINPRKTISELLRTVRLSLYIKTCGEITVADTSIDEANFIRDTVRNLDISTIENIFNLTLRATEEIHKSLHPDIALEMNIVKIAIINHTVSIDSIIQNINKLRKGNIDSPAAGAIKSDTGKPVETKSPGSKPEAKSAGMKKQGITTSPEKLLELIKSKSNMTGIYLEKADEIVFNENSLNVIYNSKSVYSDNIQRAEHLENIKKLVKKYYTYDIDVNVSVTGNQKNREKTDVQPSGKKDAIINSKPLKDALEIFGGKIIKINKGEQS